MWTADPPVCGDGLREGDEGAAAIREAVRGKAKEGFKLYISEKGARGLHG